MNESAFFDCFADYGFAAEQARWLVTVYSDYEGEIRGVGEFSTKDLDSKSAIRKAKNLRKKKLLNLIKAIDDLYSNNHYLNVSDDINEYLRDNHDYDYVLLNRIRNACINILHKDQGSTKQGRRKDIALNEAVHCFLNYRMANSLSTSTFFNGGLPNEVLVHAERFLEDSNCPIGQSLGSLNKRIERINTTKRIKK